MLQEKKKKKKGATKTEILTLLKSDIIFAINLIDLPTGKKK